ncbi:CorA family divalent cation transporter [Actinomadura madurae]|uniref:CorA family divalent cation transporter n=1 Tax=Actinomadura madurae TaxID=1993 RepID=UPI0024E27463|nr:CorA family divalent cation transporter [Actinomadura madurae]
MSPTPSWRTSTRSKRPSSPPSAPTSPAASTGSSARSSSSSAPSAPSPAPLRNLSGRRFVPAEIKEYLRDVEDHLTRVREQVESYDELLNPILQAHMTQVTVADNQDMRKISAWGAIFMVPTAIAGVYGMNFDFMPETQWRFGYPMILGVIGFACLSLYRGFRRNGWL